MSFLRRATPAALAGALALSLAACEPDLAPAFEPEGTGTIAGRLFFDADDNDLYTPTGGDTVLVGVPIQVRERGTDDALASTTTAADGTFQFAGVPVGTHDVYVVADDLGEVIFCSNPLPASVYRDEQAYVNAVGKVACIIDIAEAKELDVGELAIIVGTVTAPPGTYRGNNLYVQDETGGMQVFGVSTPGILLGDVIEVRAPLGAFNSELQLTGSPIIEVLGNTAVPAPIVLDAGTLGGITDPKDPAVGALAKVEGAVVGDFGFGGDANNAEITDASGSAQIRLDVNAATTIGTDAFTTGHCYDITGIVGIFRNVTQLKPRFPSDVEEVPCP